MPASTSCLVSPADFAVETACGALQFLPTIEDRVWRKVKSISIAIASVDDLLLGADGRRLI